MSEKNRKPSGKRTSNTGAGKAGQGRNGRGTAARSSSSSPSSRTSRNRPGYGKSGYAYSGSSRGGSGRRYYKRRKKRDVTQWLVYGVAFLIVILAVALVFRGCKGGAAALESTEETGPAQEKAGGITVDGVSIEGMSQEEARAAILAQYNWDMKVTYQDKEASVGNLMEEKIDDILEEIYAGSAETQFEVNTDNLLEPAKAEAALIAGEWNLVAQNGGISGYDKETGKFTFTEGSNGTVIDQEQLAQDIVDAIGRKDYQAVIAAQVKDVEPEMTAAELEAKYTTIGTYTTTATNNKARNENLRLSCAALNGTIVNPGQEFSFNEATGARTTEKGYQPATAYLNGEVVQEPGGGVCQVSSTLYNAVIFAGLKSTERHAHSYEPSYVTPGEDAAVSYGGPDFKFVNNSSYPIAIKASFENQKVTLSIYGIPVLEDGVKVRMESEKTAALDPPAPTYEEDQTLQPDEEKVVKQPTPGSRWNTELVVYKDGAEISREDFHTSSYRGKAAIIKRNTSGVVLTTEAPTESAPAPTESAPAETAGAQTPGGDSGASGPGAEPQTQGPGTEVPETVQPPAGEGGGQAENPVVPQAPDSPGDVGPAGE